MRWMIKKMAINMHNAFANTLTNVRDKAHSTNYRNPSQKNRLKKYHLKELI